jgi:dolichyl-phosphate beta-glucosyltransferase
MERSSAADPAPPGAIRLSVVIPAYNEEDRVGPTLRRLASYLAARGEAFELLLVDDGSRDETVRAARDAAVPLRILVLAANRGKGAAVREGMLAAHGERVLFTDADLSTPIEDLPRLEGALERGAAVAFGSRSVRGAEVLVRQPLYRQTMGKAFNLFVRACVLPGVIDSQCGFKLFEARAARQIFSRQLLPGFSFDVEVLFLARRLGHAIEEVPVRWTNSPASRVHPVRDSFRMLRDLLRVRWYAWRGRYD